nr:uncharacterized protein LOC131780531 isoform X1 [Pocillopora verrucosa]
MSQFLGRSKQGDKGYQLFLTFSELTKDFHVTILRKRDKIDFEEYLKAVEKKIKGSRCVWNGNFQGIGQNPQGKKVAEENDTSREAGLGQNPDGKKVGEENDTSGEEYQRPNFFKVDMKSGSLEDSQLFDKEKIEEMNFGESQRFILLANCNASRITSKLAVMDGKDTVLEDEISIDLLVSNRKPSGEKIAVENYSDVSCDRGGYSEQEPIMP